MEKLPVPVKKPGDKPFAFRGDNPEARMTFIEHLGELRTRLVRSGIAVFIAVIICYVFSDAIITAMARPLLGEGSPLIPASVTDVNPEDTSAKEVVQAEWVTLSPIEGVLVKIKVSAYVGILLCLPYVLYQGCAFVFPGLKPREKATVQLLLAGCCVLGILGVGVAYFFVFPLVLPYLSQFSPEFVSVQLRMSETLSVLVKGFIGFAIAFQFPLAVLVLVAMGILTPKTLKEHRRTAIVVLCVASMILTPPDPLSMVIMAVPLVLLYELSIWASYLVLRRKKPEPAA